MHSDHSTVPAKAHSRLSSSDSREPAPRPGQTRRRGVHQSDKSQVKTRQPLRYRCFLTRDVKTTPPAKSIEHHERQVLSDAHRADNSLGGPIRRYKGDSKIARLFDVDPFAAS
jgi:hypothetical protein